MSYAPLMGPDDPTGILEMVFRLGPRMMRTGGGGGIKKECPNRWNTRRHKITDEERQRVADLAKSGKNGTEIARIMGISQSSACKTLERAGIKANDGRKRSAVA